MAVQSIWTTIQVRNVAGDHLFITACEMAFRKMNRVGKLHHFAQEVGTRSETLQDAGHLRAPGRGAPFVVDGGGLAIGIGVFDDADLR